MRLFRISCAALFFAFSFGAQADDCRFIREALRALPAEGGTVLVPNGTYTCTTPLVLDHSNVTLRGEGSVTLRLADRAEAPVIVMGEIKTPPNPVHNVRVVNLRIDGNRQNQTGECWGGRCDSGGLAYIRNNGITVRKIINGRIENVFVTSPRSGGVVTEHGCRGLVIDGLAVTDSHFDGFAGYDTTGSDLRHLSLFGNRAAAVSLDLNFSGNRIRDSHFYRNGDVSIFMRESNDNLFENLLIEDAGSHGIFLAFADDPRSCPVNNEFRNLTVLRSKGVGFLLNNDCAGNFLSGEAIFRQNRDGCIREPRSEALGRPAKYHCQN